MDDGTLHITYIFLTFVTVITLHLVILQVGLLDITDSVAIKDPFGNEE